MNQLLYTQIAQTYLHLVTILGLLSLVVSIVGSLYLFITKNNDTFVNSYAVKLANIFLLFSLLVQSIIMLVTAILLGWTNSQRRLSSEKISDLVLSSDIHIWGLSPYLTIDFFGSLLVCLAFFIGSLSLVVSDTRLKLESSPLFFYFNFFIIIVFALVMVQDIYILFIAYEFLLLPSFFFILFGSYTNKAVQASLYFVIWTQIGSFLVLGGVVYLVSLVGYSDYSSIRAFKFKQEELTALYFIFFLGFGIKVPIWPFHYWLTKTHVEAPSGFSIYLSGFLVKTALYSFFKITNLICYETNTIFFAVIAVIGIVDASLKLWGQSDIKKIVAYCTVQEMNLIFLLFLFGDANATTCGATFSVAHAFLSALMFFLVDCIYRRCHTRSIYAIHGLLQQTPNLAISIIVMCVLYSGLPGTLKFSCEISLLLLLSETGLSLILLIIITANIFAVIGFSKGWLNTIFGLPSKELDIPMLDLSLKEFLIILYIILLFFASNGLAFLCF